MFDTLFERRVSVRPNGDLWEWLTLTLTNTSPEPLSITAQLDFIVTDSLTEVRSARGPCSGSWFREPSLEGVDARYFVHPQTPVPGDYYATFGISILRQRRVAIHGKSISIDDPLLFLDYQGLPVRQSEYRVYVMFPEQPWGWGISAPGATHVTTRMVAWSFGRGAKIENIQAIATEKRRGNAALIEYDNKGAQLCMAAGKSACGELLDGHESLGIEVLADRDMAREFTTAAHANLEQRAEFLRSVPQPKPRHRPGRTTMIVNVNNSDIKALAVGFAAQATVNEDLATTTRKKNRA